MVKIKDDEIKKYDESITSKVKISKDRFGKLRDYCKEQKISKYDALNEIIDFLYETKMPISALNIQNVTQLVRNYHNHTAGVLHNFENNFLSKLDKNHAENIDFLTKTLSLTTQSKNKDGVLMVQIFKLLRALISANVEEEDAKILLNESLLEVQKAEQLSLANMSKEPFILEGRVGQNPKIETSTKEQKLYFMFTLAQHTELSSQTIWHNVVMWEGQFTQKMQLKEEQAIKKFFNGIKTGDKLILKGYNTEGKYKDKEQNDIIKTTYIVTDVISHTPKKIAGNDNKA